MADFNLLGTSLTDLYQEVDQVLPLTDLYQEVDQVLPLTDLYQEVDQVLPLTDLYQEVDPLEFSYLDTLDSASLQHLDHLAEQHHSKSPVNNNSIQNNRFPTPLNSVDFRQSLRDRIPKNTRHSNTWSMTVFNQWREWRLGQADTVLDEHYPIPDLDRPVHHEDVARLDY